MLLFRFPLVYLRITVDYSKHLQLEPGQDAQVGLGTAVLVSLVPDWVWIAAVAVAAESVHVSAADCVAADFGKWCTQLESPSR